MKRDCRAPCSTVSAIADLEGRLVHVTDSLLHEWGYHDAEELLGQPMASLWQCEDEPLDLVEALGHEGSWTT